MHHLTQSPVQKDPPRHCFLSISPPDSNSAPLPKRCEGHPAGGPLSGELLLSGGGASQQARGGGQVCSVACIWSQQHNNVSPLLCFFIVLLPFSCSPSSAAVTQAGTCKNMHKKMQEGKKLHKHGQGSNIGPATACLQGSSDTM